jgi:hypothetical protein
MTLNFIGTHHNTCKNLVEWTRDLQPAIVTLTDIDITAIERAMMECNQTMFVIRIPPDDGLDIGESLPNLFHQTVKRLEPAIARMKAAIGVATMRQRMRIAPFNEPTIKAAMEMNRYNDLTLMLMKWADDIGIRLAIGGFAEGNPPIGLWRQYEPALTYAADNDHWLTLHEYDWPKMDSTWPWRTGRVLQLLHGNVKLAGVHLDDAYTGLPEPTKSKIRIAITEAGLDGTSETPPGQKPHGWKSQPELNHQPPKYMRQISQYVKRLVVEPQIKGISLYQQGDLDKWKNFEITRLKKLLLENPQPIYDYPPIVVPPEEPAMIDRPRIGLHLRNGMYSPREFELIAHAGIEAVKVMTDPVTPISNIIALAATFPKMPITARLYHPELRNGNVVPATQYCVDMGLRIKELLRHDIRDFVIHNEPNHHDGLEGWSSSTADAYRFRAWYRVVRQTLQQMFPEARFQFPGLAVMQNDKMWWWVNRNQIERTEALSVHCYWQKGNWSHYDWGQRHLQARAKFNDHDFPFYIGEFGDSDPDHNEEMIAHTVTKWYQAQSAYPYIKASYAYIASSPDPAWSQFTWMDENGRFKPVVEAVRNMDRTPEFMPAQIGKFMKRNPKANAYKLRPLGDIEGVVWHHAAVVASPSDVWNYHIAKWNWPGAGYTFYIGLDGTVYQFWALDRVAYHTKGHNPTTIGACYEGEYTKHRPPPHMIAQARRLKSYLEAKLGRQLESTGHHDLNPSTLCPGKVPSVR